MAGIGFELQRALRGGSIVKALTVAITGIVIVAGPWLLSIIGISILTGVASYALNEGQELFIAVLVYGYAFSICIFAGLHYAFTRYISDLLYLGKNHRVTASLLLMSGFVTVLSLLIAIPSSLALGNPGIAHAGLLRVGMVIFFVAINLIWIEMLVITVLKNFLAIIGAYLAGMLVSVGAAVWLGSSLGLGGALLGFALGQASVALILFAVVMAWNLPSRARHELRPLLRYAGTYRTLMLSGWLYSAGLWIDKIVFWFSYGKPIQGTFLHLYQDYDYAAYIANLSVIPALVFFTIFTETTFFVGLRRLLMKLGTSIYTRIAEEKYNLKDKSRRIIGRQLSFHGLLVIVLLASLSGLLVKILVVAVFFHMAFLTFFTFLFYLESYRLALRGSAIFFGVNLAATLVSAHWGGVPLGSGYLLASICACLFTGIALYRNLGDLDRLIFSRN
ncbi:MAG: exopolysaccharide Pel transporter PelG [Treponema sp.]|nr:exopolysaccharide Pel transporter PelG [Treponema sp.]